MRYAELVGVPGFCFFFFFHLPMPSRYVVYRDTPGKDPFITAPEFFLMSLLLTCAKQ